MYLYKLMCVLLLFRILNQGHIVIFPKGDDVFTIQYYQYYHWEKADEVFTLLSLVPLKDKTQTKNVFGVFDSRYQFSAGVNDTGQKIIHMEWNLITGDSKEQANIYFYFFILVAPSLFIQICK